MTPLFFRIAFLLLLFFSREKKSSDFWLSQPLTRREHLLANLITSLIAFVISIVPSWYISLITAHIFTTEPPVSLGKILLVQTPALLFVILFFVCILSIAFLACTVSGSVICSLLFFATFLGYPALITIFSAYVSDSVFHTPLLEIFTHKIDFFVYSSPVLRYFFSFAEGYAHTALDYILYALLTAGVIAVLFVLVKRKKSELSQSSVTFPVLRYPLQYIWCFFITLFAAWLFYTIIRSPIWFVIGAVVGLILSFMFFNMIFERSVSLVFKKSSHIAVCAAIFTLITAVFIADVFAMYKEPRPDFDKIEDFSVYYSASSGNDEGETYTWTDVYNDTDTSLDKKDREILEFLYNYASNRENSVNTSYESNEWYSISVNINCKGDPSSWHKSIGYQVKNEDIIKAVNYLYEKLQYYFPSVPSLYYFTV